MLRLCCLPVLLCLVPQVGDEFKEYAGGTIRKIVGTRVILSIKDKDDKAKDVEFYVGKALEPFDVDGKKLKPSALLWILQKGNVIDVKTKKVDGKSVGEKGEVDFAIQVKAIKVLKANELLLAGTEWIGTYKETKIVEYTENVFINGKLNTVLKRKSVITTGDFRFVVKSRNEEEFKAEMWFKGSGLEVAGKIEKSGVARFTPSKEIKGSHWPRTVIGYLRFEVTVAGNQMRGKAAMPILGAEIDLKLKESTDKGS